MNYLTTIRQMEARQTRYEEALARILSWRRVCGSAFPLNSEPLRVWSANGTPLAVAARTWLPALIEVAEAAKDHRTNACDVPHEALDAALARLDEVAR